MAEGELRTVAAVEFEHWNCCHLKGQAVRVPVAQSTGYFVMPQPRCSQADHHPELRRTGTVFYA